MAKKKRRRKPLLTREERADQADKRRFTNAVRLTFTNAGFEYIKTADKQMAIGKRQGELDKVFVIDNLVVVVEETTSNAQAEIKDHLRKKAEFVESVKAKGPGLLTALSANFPKFAAYLEAHPEFDLSDYRCIFVYCFRHTLDSEYQERFSKTFVFLSYPHLLYFHLLTRTIYKSARYELFRFLRLAKRDVGLSQSDVESRTYDAMLLPESPSGFPEGHKLVSLLARPITLLEGAYVLRTNGWEAGSSLYQRLLIRGKIKDMRNYLATEGRVFINNLIVTLPNTTQLQSKDGKPVTLGDATDMTPLQIVLPSGFGTIGIIDGQHRLYCYHEGHDKHDTRIARLRKKQHLLVTGIIYPKIMPEDEKTKFEAQLFLEINDKQNRVKTELRQDILTIVNPRSAVAIAKAVIQHLAQSGPLAGELQQYFFDFGKIKTASIVSYGLVHVVRPRGPHSLWSLWNGATAVGEDWDPQLYAKFCATKINELLIAFKKRMSPLKMWTRDKKISTVLTTTTINGVIYCFRMLLQTNQVRNLDFYEKALSNLSVSFSPNATAKYKSSNWKSLGLAIFACFPK